MSDAPVIERGSIIDNAVNDEQRGVHLVALFFLCCGSESRKTRIFIGPAGEKKKRAPQAKAPRTLSRPGAGRRNPLQEHINPRKNGAQDGNNY
jgi:hypothetical protein